MPDSAISTHLAEQMIKQGARSDGNLLVVPSDRVFLLDANVDPVPPWVISSPLLKRLGSTRLFALNLINCVGHLRLGPLELEAVSTKLSQTAFRRLVTEVSNYIVSLPFSHRGAGSGYRFAHRDDMPIAYHALVYVSDLLRSGQLQTAVGQITANPHVLFVRERRYVRVEQARRVDAATVRLVCAVPRHLEPVAPGARVARSSLGTCLEETPVAGHFPGRVSSSRMVGLVDNPENQFVRHALEWMLRAADSLLMYEHCPRDIVAEAQQTVNALERLLAHDLFRLVSRPHQLSLSSQVLQRRAGYREMLTYFSQLMLPPTPTWPQDLGQMLELKDAATLYEYWVFVTICRMIEEILSAAPVEATAACPPWVQQSPLEVALSSDIEVRFPEGVVVRYQDLRRGYSGVFCPDVTLTTPAGMWVFDAKFRLGKGRHLDDVLHRDEDDQSDVSAKSEDIDKMHAYRDALPGCRGAYVVYPGDAKDLFPAPVSGVCGALPVRDADPVSDVVDGVGALPARPTGNPSHLSDMLRVLLTQTPTHAEPLGPHTFGARRLPDWP
jgi:predicted component of viral defense system (DUF524 family)